MSIHTAYVYTFPQSLVRLCSCLLLPWPVLIFNRLQVLSILHICRPLSPFHPLFLLPCSSLPMERPTPTKETESRLQTGVVLIKLLKRTCIQGWFRPGCSYVQPHATNVRKDVWVLCSVSFGLHKSTYLRDPSYLYIDPFSSLSSLFLRVFPLK